MTTKHQKLIKRFLAIGLGLVLVIVLKDQALAAFNINQNLNAVDSALINTWKVILSVSNIAVLLMLIIIGFSTIFKIQLDTYHIKKAIIPIIVGIILANFSLVICRTGLDLANILTVNLKNQIVVYETGGTGDKEAQAIRRVFMPQQLLDAFKGEGVNGWTKVGGAALGLGTLAAIFSAGAWTGVILVVVIFSVLLLLPALAVWALAILFYSRTWMLFFLITLSPLAFLCISWGPVQSFFKRWWNQFLLWTFMVPIAYVFFWLAVVIHRNIGETGEFSLGSYTAGLVLLWLALVTPFKLGGAVGALLGGVMKKYGGVVAGWGKGAAWGKYNRAMEERFRGKDPEWMMNTKYGRALRWGRRIVAPRMPSWRSLSAGMKQAREREEKQLMAGPAATAEEWYRSYMLRPRFFPGNQGKGIAPGLGGYLTSGGPFGKGRLAIKGFGGGRQASQWASFLREGSQTHPYISQEQILAAISQGANPQEVAQMAYSFASNSPVPLDSSITDYLEKNLSPERFADFKRIIKKSLAGVRNDQDYNNFVGSLSGPSAILSKEFSGASASLLAQTDVAVLQRLLARLVGIERKDQELLNNLSGGDDNKKQEIINRAQAEQTYYNTNPDNPHRSILIGELSAALGEHLGDQEKAEFKLEDIGLGYGYRKALEESITPANLEYVLRDTQGQGHQFLESIANMQGVNPGALRPDSGTQRAAQALHSHYNSESRLNSQLQQNFNINLPSEPANEVFNIEARQINDSKIKGLLKELLQAGGDPKRFTVAAAQAQLSGKGEEEIGAVLDQVKAELGKLSDQTASQIKGLENQPGLQEAIKQGYAQGQKLEDIFRSQKMDAVRDNAVREAVKRTQAIIARREQSFQAARSVVAEFDTIKQDLSHAAPE